jgi:threonine/homoserine/homoserine lactone efflux protein
VVAAITPGPSNIMLTAAGANAGVLRGLPCLLGVVTGMGAMMFLVPLGLGSLVLRSAWVLSALHWGGAAVLLWLSWKIASSRRLESGSGGNPVGYGGAAAFHGGSAIAQSAFLGGLFIAGALPSCFLWLVFGATVQRVLRDPRGLRVFNIAMGALLALSIVLIV